MFDTIWYDNLIKPALTPNASVFGPAWTILYILIFISLVLYIKKAYRGNKLNGYLYFILQLALNMLWSPAFFIHKNIGVALIIIILLDISVILTIKEFFKVSRKSAYFLIPYLLWIIFATYLNISFFVLN